MFVCLLAYLLSRYQPTSSQYPVTQILPQFYCPLVLCKPSWCCPTQTSPHPTPVYQVTAGLGTSSPTEAQPGSPGRGRGSNGRQQSQRQPLLQLLGDPHEDQAAHLLQMRRGSSSRSCMFPGWFPRLCEPLWSQVS